MPEDGGEVCLYVTETHSCDAIDLPIPNDMCLPDARSLFMIWTESPIPFTNKLPETITSPLTDTPPDIFALDIFMNNKQF
jgi:hypothetical protein